MKFEVPRPPSFIADDPWLARAWEAGWARLRMRINDVTPVQDCPCITWEAHAHCSVAAERARVIDDKLWELLLPTASALAHALRITADNGRAYFGTPACWANAAHVAAMEVADNSLLT